MLARSWCTLALALALVVACRPQTAPRPDAAPVASPSPRYPDGWRYAAPLPVAEGRRGIVVTDAAPATDVGIAVLVAGGNAVDAAVAIGFALAVVYPEAGNLGGGGFAVVRLADDRKRALDFRETAPARATRDMFLDAAGEPDAERSLTGHLAAGVPGTVAGLVALHEAHGSRPLTDLVAPAIDFARGGFVVDERLAASVAGEQERLARFPATAAWLLPGGAPPAVGTRLANPDLARTLERIAAKGRDGFYTGETAALVAAEMRAGRGLVDEADLAAYRAVWREPIRFGYRGHEIIAMPPPSSGGVVLALIAGMLESRGPRRAWHTPAALHERAEVFRRAYAERNQHLGDPDQLALPIARLLAPAYARELAVGIAARATPSSQLVPSVPEGDHTTHFAVADAMGNVVALTYTLNANYGSAVTVAGAGFLLNDEMDDFAARPGRANLFGLVQGETNAIAPGKRMLSSMSPTIVLSPTGAPLLVVGGRGGSRIITAVFQVIANVIDHGLAAGDAVAAPRIHHQHLPDELRFEEGGLLPETVAALTALGHVVVASPLPDSPVASVSALLRRRGGWTGVADPRRGGAARGY